MTGYGGGYVTDVAYMPGYYPHQSPRHLAAACLLGGVAPPEPARMDRLSFLELGCGQGYGAMVQAASNPGWQVTAIDFNPAHIAAARGFAAQAGLTNIRFLEADLATLAEDPQSAMVPQADVVSMHGVWSWVPQAVRDGIVRLLGAKLLPGGIAHVSYNALPAWQGALGMQRLLLEAGQRLSRRSDRQVKAGVGIAQALKEAGAEHLTSGSFVTALIDQLGTLPAPYLAHEYMNQCWSPCFHADVAAHFAGAKLEWAASASLIENFPELAMTAAQRTVHDRFEDPAMRELVKDLCLARGLRQDVFVRGARRLDVAARDAALRGLTLALVRPAGAFIYHATVPAGDAKLEPHFYRPIVEALGHGPRLVGDLLDLVAAAEGSSNPAELVGMLVGTGQAIVTAPATARPVSGAAHRFNDLAAHHLVGSDNLTMAVALASERLGTGLPCQIMELFVGARLPARGEAADLDGWVDGVSKARDVDDHGKLRGFLARMLEERAPHWRALQIM